MRYLILLGLLAAAPAFSDSIAINGKLITDGDGAGKLLQVAGKPDRIVQLETEYGGATGERWEYYREGKTLQIEIRSGRVSSIIEMR